MKRGGGLCFRTLPQKEAVQGTASRRLALVYSPGGFFFPDTVSTLFFAGGSRITSKRLRQQQRAGCDALLSSSAGRSVR